MDVSRRNYTRAIEAMLLHLWTDYHLPASADLKFGIKCSACMVLVVSLLMMALSKDKLGYNASVATASIATRWTSKSRLPITLTRDLCARVSITDILNLSRTPKD